MWWTVADCFDTRMVAIAVKDFWVYQRHESTCLEPVGTIANMTLVCSTQSRKFNSVLCIPISDPILGRHCFGVFSKLNYWRW